MPKSSTIPNTSPDSSFEAQYKRILEAAACKTQAGLADFLGIRQSSVSDARRRQSIPPEWYMKLFEKNQVNPEWVKSGTGTKFLNTAESLQNMPHVVKVVEIRPPAECSAQELFNELVRRAPQPLDIETVQKEVMGTWHTRQGVNE